MLYVMGKKAKLGQMAHEYAQVNKNRAEVCCLIGKSRQSDGFFVKLTSNTTLRSGNYYSAREEHTKAIQYFRRSLLLNRDYLPAWTLLGHEFVELKNSHAAIEAYRRAIGT
jgi:anaphase-promoting complex subunit 8